MSSAAVVIGGLRVNSIPVLGKNGKLFINHVNFRPKIIYLLALFLSFSPVRADNERGNGCISQEDRLN